MFKKETKQFHTIDGEVFCLFFCFSRTPKPFCSSSVDFHQRCHQKPEIWKALIYSLSWEKASEGLYCPAVILQIHTECTSFFILFPYPEFWLLVYRITSDVVQVTLDLPYCYGLVWCSWDSWLTLLPSTQPTLFFLLGHNRTAAGWGGHCPWWCLWLPNHLCRWAHWHW